MRRRLLRALAVLATAGVTQPVRAALESDPEDGPWPAIRGALFGTRPLIPDDHAVGIEAPFRAEDAAVVPVRLFARTGPPGQARIARLWLIIDRNPAPIAMRIEVAEARLPLAFETRVRVDQNTHMQVVAEYTDGRLAASRAFVRGAGGCSAPSASGGGDAEANLGRIKLRVDGPAQDGTRQVVLMIRHPNHSGLQFDQFTQSAPQAHYVKRIELRLDDAPLLSLEGDISLSENPYLGFVLAAELTRGRLAVRVRDSRDLVFEAAATL